MAQVQTIMPLAARADNDPRGGFTLSLRFTAGTQVRFLDVGNIASAGTLGDMTSEMLRVYDDGFVALDTRTNQGGDVGDDYTTNRWRMDSVDQVVEDETAIAFHSYSSVAEGSFEDVDSGRENGLDFEFAQRWGRWGDPMPNGASRFIWGGLGGVSIDFINAKTRDTITTSLRTVTDLYSLEGFAPPTGPYLAPSTQEISVTDSTGQIITTTIDTTIFLANRPFSRTETIEPEAAAVDGFWQVRGASMTARAGLWARWNVNRLISLRASAGASVSVLGLDARYDEWISSLETLELIRTSAESETDKPVLGGFFATLDAELWFTRSTGLLAGLSYQQLSNRAQIAFGDRVAEIELSSGLGARFGLTYRF